MNRNDYKATPVADLRLNDSDKAATNGPVEKTAASKALDKRWSTSGSNDTATRDTGFKRGIPGCDNC